VNMMVIIAPILRFCTHTWTHKNAPIACVQCSCPDKETLTTESIVGIKEKAVYYKVNVSNLRKKCEQ